MLMWTGGNGDRGGLTTFRGEKSLEKDLRRRRVVCFVLVFGFVCVVRSETDRWKGRDTGCGGMAALIVSVLGSSGGR